MFLSTTASSASTWLQFFSRRAARFRAAHPGARDFRAFFREADPARADGGHLRVEIVRRRNLRLQFRQFLQEVPIGRVVLLEPALYA